MIFERPKFSPVIQLGQIVQAITIIVSVGGSVWAVSARMTSNEKDIEFAQSTIEDIKKQNERTLETLNSLNAAIARVEGKLSVTKE